MKFSAINVQQLAKVAAIVLVLCGTAVVAVGEDKSGTVLGDWHGSSTCLVRPSACHDEEALYHVKEGAKPGTYSMQADKVVNGTPQMMGTAECQIKQAALRCDFPRGYLELTLQGDHLDGAMFLPDRTRWREIKLVRVKK